MTYIINSRDPLPENITLFLNTKHKDILTANVSKIEVTNSTYYNKWPIELLGHDVGHDLLKVDSLPPLKE